MALIVKAIPHLSFWNYFLGLLYQYPQLFKLFGKLATWKLELWWWDTLLGLVSYFVLQEELSYFAQRRHGQVPWKRILEKPNRRKTNQTRPQTNPKNNHERRECRSICGQIVQSWCFLWILNLWSSSISDIFAQILYYLEFFFFLLRNLMLRITEYNRAEPELALLIFPRNMCFSGLKKLFSDLDSK